MKRDPSTPTASVHYLPNAGQAPYPCRGNGRLPKSVASIRVARRTREIARRTKAVHAEFEAHRIALLMLNEIENLRGPLPAATRLEMIEALVEESSRGSA